MRNKQYLFFDIDGTLIDAESKTLQESAKKALRLAREKGHKVFINSGRTYCGLPPYLLKEFDGLLCGCGTNIHVDGKELLHVVLPLERVQEIMQSAEAHKVHVVFEGRDAMYFKMDYMEHPLAERWYNNYCKQGTKTILYRLGDSISCSKFCVGAVMGSDMEGFLKSIEKDFDIIGRDGGFYEVLPRGYSKSTAMEEVLRFYGGARADTWAFGDSNNDLPMLRYAKHAVIMGEHSEGLERYAEFVADTVNNHGLYKIMKQQGII